MDDAFSRLRAHARNRNLKLSSLAASLVERPSRRITCQLVESTGKSPERMTRQAGSTLKRGQMGRVPPGRRPT
ncbi:MAG: hypothetical protein M3N98_12780 [Actinomycetota bacterium]|nr:hypothetical protein [Actinomycetota bacterium]